MANPFKGIGQLGGIIKQAQEMAENAKKLEQELAEMTFEAESGGGLVTAVVSGTGKLQSVSIKPEAVDPDDLETLEDLVVAAVRAANEKASETRTQKAQELTGGMDVGGLAGLGGLFG